MSNILHFSELSPSMQEKLIQYIRSRFSKRKTINHAELIHALASLSKVKTEAQ